MIYCPSFHIFPGVEYIFCTAVDFSCHTSKEPFHNIKSLLCFFIMQALDVWAMGVTLYCFVFGVVSVIFGRNTYSKYCVFFVVVVLEFLLKDNLLVFHWNQDLPFIHSVHLWMSASSVFIRKSRLSLWSYLNSQFCSSSHPVSKDCPVALFR